ncbi:hypothetical protein [Halomicronema sp. CCY15110]|uniref:hypothetical protein n=1 Tax=Halomicronema sp. CCY15110 TaxID=2767773 RepID=UPI00194F3622|nr:hypothetical protein [Halomicronema sp. CCY15110]
MPKLIVYACPVGQLAEQLDVYFAQSRVACGPNAAHQYMPHCTLTGFFEDTTSSIPAYADGLARSRQQHWRSQPHPPIVITGLTFRENWHGLELSSAWLQQWMGDFDRTVTAPTGSAPLRLKSWLHLSLAYGFDHTHHTTLQELAQTLIDPQSPVEWELRLYERHADGTWTCHQRLSI